MFSFTPKAIVVPDVPTPAPAVISPVAFSSTVMFITFESNVFPSIISEFTSLKKFKFLRLFIDLLARISLKGSPSSISN